MGATQNLKAILGLSGAVIALVGIVALVLLPIITAAGWYFGWWSFETAAIVLLVIAAYGGD